MGSLIKTLIPSFLLSFACVVAAASDSPEDEFLKCLREKSQKSNPIEGFVYGRRNPSFTSTLQYYIRDQRFNTSQTHKPIAIVTAAHESHVQAAILCAKTQGLQLRVRSGGHDYEGLSYVSPAPFVLLDMFNLRNIEVNPENGTAVVQAGATLGELYYSVAESSKNTLAFPAGHCPTIGVAGHISGGGLGSLARKCGLSADNVLDAQIVDVYGNISDGKAMGADLFWAIRGGGGASFGVVLSWTLQLVQVPDTVTVFVVEKTLEQGLVDAVYKWQQVADAIDGDDNLLYISVLLSVVNKTDNNNNNNNNKEAYSSKSKHGGVNEQLAQQGTKKKPQRQAKTVKATFTALYLGQTKGLVLVMKDAFPELSLKRSDCKEMSWIESVLLFGHYHPNGTAKKDLLNRKPPFVPFAKHKSDVVPAQRSKEAAPISKEALNRTCRKLMELESVALDLRPLGGRMGEIGSKDTPFPYRANYKFIIHYMVYWTEAGKDVADEKLSLIRKMYEFMTPFVAKNPRSAYLNFRDLDIGKNEANRTDYNKAFECGNKYFKGNYKRLTRAKARADPDNFFRHEQSIPPLQAAG